jgi:hypothetical protein
MENNKLLLTNIFTWDSYGLWKGWNAGNILEALKNQSELMSVHLCGIVPNHQDDMDVRGWELKVIMYIRGMKSYWSFQTSLQKTVCGIAFGILMLPKKYFFCWTLLHWNILKSENLIIRGIEITNQFSKEYGCPSLNTHAGKYG